MKVTKTEADYRNRLIYKKTKAEKMKLKSIKHNLDRPFMNETIIHLSADSDVPTIILKKNNKKLKQAA